MQDKKKRGAATRKTSKPSRQRKPAKGASMPGRRRRNVQGESIAKSVKTSDPTSFKEGPLMSSRHGRGQRFVGTQVLQSVTLTASDSQMWTGTAPAVAITANLLYLNPDSLNGRLAVFANTYTKYAFRRVVLEYEPYVATTQAGAAVLAIVNDPQDSVTAVPTYTTAQDIVPSVNFALRERASLTYTYNGDDLFFTEYDGTSGASVRQTVQASIWGFPSASSIGAITAGIVRIHYVIDMFGPTNTLGIVLSGLSKAEKEQVMAYADKLRANRASLQKSTVTVDLSKVPLEKSGITAPPPTPNGSGSSSSLSSGAVSSGWFRVN